MLLVIVLIALLAKLAASTFLTKPVKPTRLNVTAGLGSSEVALTLALSDGSGALTRWEYTKDDGTTWLTVSNAMGAVIDGGEATGTITNGGWWSAAVTTGMLPCAP